MWCMRIDLRNERWTHWRSASRLVFRHLVPLCPLGRTAVSINPYGVFKTLLYHKHTDSGYRNSDYAKPRSTAAGSFSSCEVDEMLGCA